MDDFKPENEKKTMVQQTFTLEEEFSELLDKVVEVFAEKFRKENGANFKKSDYLRQLVRKHLKAVKAEIKRKQNPTSPYFDKGDE